MPGIRIILPVVIATPLASCLRREPAQSKGPDPVGLRPDAPVYARHGPFWVGTRDFRIDDAKRPIPLTVWYLALNLYGAKEEITYTDVVLKYDVKLPAGTRASAKEHAVRKTHAALDRSKGPYPLILFSHGLGDSRPDQPFLTEHLASQGFVVIAPDHTEWWSEDLATIWKDSIPRPQDIPRVIAFAETLATGGGALPGAIDMQRIGIAGVSYGGFTALAAAGARFALDEFNTRCAAVPKNQAPHAACVSLTSHEANMADICWPCRLATTSAGSPTPVIRTGALTRCGT